MPIATSDGVRTAYRPAARLCRSLAVLLVALAATVSAPADQVTYSYDGLGRLKSIAFADGTSVVYGLDGDGNRVLVNTAVDTAPPTVPALSLVSATSLSVVLSWTASSDTGGSGLAGYRIYRNGALVATTSVSPYTDTTVAGTTAYTYTIAAFDYSRNTSALSSPLAVTTPDTLAPSVPTGLTATSTSSLLVNLLWTASTDTGGSGLAGYKVYRGGGQIGTSASASYNDGTVAGSTAYSYTVASYDNAGNISAQSAPASVTTPDTLPPSVPGTPVAGSVTANQVNLSWAVSTDTGGSGLAGYKLYRNGSLLSTAAPANYSDTTVTPSTAYGYAVSAYDNAGNTSALSAALNVTTPAGIPAPPTISASLSTTVPNSFFTVSWTAAGGATSYQLYEANLDVSPTGTLIYTGTALSQQRSKGRGVWEYWVQACSSVGCSAISNTVQVSVCTSGGNC